MMKNTAILSRTPIDGNYDRVLAQYHPPFIELAANSTVVLDWGTNRTEYEVDHLAVLVDQEHPAVVYTLHFNSALVAMVADMLTENHGARAKRGNLYYTAAADTVRMVAKNLGRAAREQFVPTNTFSNMDGLDHANDQKIFEYIELIMGKRRSPEDIHWTTADKYTVNALPLAVKLRRQFQKYDYRYGNYMHHLMVTKTIFSRDLDGGTSKWEMFESNITGPTEVIVHDRGYGKSTLYLFFTHPDAAVYHWRNTGGTSLCSISFMRIITLDVDTTTGTVLNDRAVFIPVGLRCSADIQLYNDIGYKFSGLLYDAEVRRAYRETVVSYARAIPPPKNERYQIGFKTNLAPLHISVVPIERFFLLPERTLIKIEAHFMGVSQPNLSAGSEFRRRDPQSAIRLYLGYSLQRALEFDELHNQSNMIDHYFAKARGGLSRFAIASYISTMTRFTRLFDLIVGDHTDIANNPLWAELRREYTLDPKNPQAAIWGLTEWHPSTTPPAIISVNKPQPIATNRPSTYANVYISITKRWHLPYIVAVFKIYLLGTPRFARAMETLLDVVEHVIGDADYGGGPPIQDVIRPLLDIEHLVTQTVPPSLSAMSEAQESQSRALW